MRPHLPALTSIRFFAALHVIVVHFGVPTAALGPWWIESFARIGSVGVSVFFTLSGFVLAYTYAGRRASLQGFYWARFARIWPVYLVSLAFALYPFRGLLGRYFDGGGNVMAFWAKFLTLTQAWTLNPSAMSHTSLLNNPTWSLSTEVAFYFAFPLLLWLATRARLRVALGSALVVWLAAMVFRLAFSQAPDVIPGWLTNEVLYKHPVFRAHEFIVGMAFGLWHLKRPRWAESGPLAWFLAVLTLVLLSVGRTAGIPGVLLHSGFLAPAVGALLACLAVGVGPARLLSGRPLVVLGEASYAIYVFHMPVALYLVEAGMVNSSTLHLLATTVVTVLLALLAYRYIEAPARKWLRGLVSPERARIEARVS